MNYSGQIILSKGMTAADVFAKTDEMTSVIQRKRKPPDIGYKSALRVVVGIAFY